MIDKSAFVHPTAIVGRGRVNWRERTRWSFFVSLDPCRNSFAGTVLKSSHCREWSCSKFTWMIGFYSSPPSAKLRPGIWNLLANRPVWKSAIVTAFAKASPFIVAQSRAVDPSRRWAADNLLMINAHVGLDSTVGNRCLSPTTRRWRVTYRLTARSSAA